VKVVGYVRVSTNGQAEDSFGRDVQRQAVKVWAKANHYRFVAIISDEGVSGARELDNRAALADALEMLRSGEVAGVVVPRLDRLTRDLVLPEQLHAEIRRHGGQLFSCSEGEAGYLADDPDDPSRRLIRQVLGAVSEYERSMIVLRLRSGRRRKAEKGGYVYGRPPYGYAARDGALVPIESEQATMTRLRELSDGGQSLRSICTTLAAEGSRT
jgi:DNA invertase Pin-like site-specific DNA recombinase